MKRRSLLAGAAAVPVLATTKSTAASTIAAPPDVAYVEPTNVRPARESLKRLLPKHHTQFALSLTGEVDRFTVSGREAAIEVTGSTPAVVLTGVNWYLKHVAGVDVSWPGSSLSALAKRLPAPRQRIEHTAVVRHRFAFNDTHEGYTGPYRDWTAWERELDLLALHGYNEVLLTTGTDAVYREVFTEFGYSAAELREWIPLPGHQPWMLMQNLSAFPGPISQHLLDSRAELARRIRTRMAELGIRPVLPGYFGTIPGGFAKRNQQARTVPQGVWYGFSRPDWLDPTGNEFAKVAASFYRHQAQLLGEADMYKMDLMHEGGDPGGIPIPDAAKGVALALQRARPGATWVMLGWRKNPRTDILTDIDTSRVLIVDGISDRFDDLDREHTWPGTPYAFGTIPNFGGHTTIGANAKVWAKRFGQWRTAPDSAVSGIAWMPEGAGRDPAAFELFAELAWRDSIDLGEWFADYADRRYGGADDNARTAWDALRRSAYAMPSGRWAEAADGLFGARPGLDVTHADYFSPEFLRYDAAVFAQALPALLDVDKSLHNDAYRFDLVDVARQSLVNAGRELLPRVKSAFVNQNKKQFDKHTRTWLDWMRLLDRLLETDRRFLLGPWLEAARRSARTADEAKDLEYDARTIVSVWGHRSGSDEGRLHDYANRELAGLVSDLYAMRWRRYFDSLAESLDSGQAPQHIDWFALEHEWASKTDDHATEPKGDPHAVATEVRDALADFRGD
ncbi:Alpha-N-acetylglucosaminidase [Stackebrandtia nassauensis DSM 44728]|uniref:Alpha-N-acetylglucosaminidase n=1 Tax=Stackebrandtia nassauensis (strain DSM 44728 / CIP 108903 / NRRL B-16338 / NBRC 102104 / LLR-40K-21) TaxID=446470 RepID=D3PXL3_STANL|nr:Alpha-N-acetylglucosaminidase [Stackebrandtia nassauensis DSM 44728]